jgi:hypothetical protein
MMMMKQNQSRTIMESIPHREKEIRRKNSSIICCMPAICCGSFFFFFTSSSIGPICAGCILTYNGYSIHTGSSARLNIMVNHYYLSLIPGSHELDFFSQICELCHHFFSGSYIRIDRRPTDVSSIITTLWVPLLSKL